MFETRQTPTEQMVTAFNAEADELLGRTIEREIAFGNLELMGKRLGDMSLRFCRYEVHPSGAALIQSLELGAPIADDEGVMAVGEYVPEANEATKQHAQLIGGLSIDDDFSFDRVSDMNLAQTNFDYSGIGIRSSNKFRIRAGVNRVIRHIRHANIDCAREFIERSMNRIVDDEKFFGLDQSKTVSVKESHKIVFNTTTSLRFNGNEDPEMITQYVEDMRERRSDLIVNLQRANNVQCTLDPNSKIEEVRDSIAALKDGFGVYLDRLYAVQDAILAAKKFIPNDEVDDNIVI